jgi:hypothetical protein
MKFSPFLAVTLSAVVLFGCGGTSDDGNTPIDRTLSAGQSATINAGQTIRVPSDTTVTSPGGSEITVIGDNNKIDTAAGSILTVAVGANGVADNIIISQ